MPDVESITGVMLSVLPSVVAALTCISGVIYAVAKVANAIGDLKESLKTRDRDAERVKASVDDLRREIALLKEKESEIYQPEAHR